MPTTSSPDVLVIGGGVAGLFCAYHLRRAGHEVTVADRGAIGDLRSCSSGNTGFAGTQGAAPLAGPGMTTHLLRGLVDPAAPLRLRPRLDGELLGWLWHFHRACNERAAEAGFRALLELKRQSLRMLHEVCALDEDLAACFTAPGMVLAFRTPQGFAEARRSVPAAVAGGVPLRVLDEAGLRALDPEAMFDISGALFNEEGAYLSVPGFVHHLGRVLARMGVRILPHTEVTGFETAGRRVRRVRTSRGDLRPRQTVIAAGVWSAECARGLGVRLRVQPVKGYAVTVKAPPGTPRLPVVLGEARMALAPLGDRLRLAGTLELPGTDRTISRRKVTAMLEAARSYLPGLAGAEPLEVWTGFRPCTPDGLPFVGRAEPYANVSVACGHGHIGMGLAPATGALIARLLAGREPDLTPFRVGRFGRPRPGGGRP